jgi:hypothetical protein
MSKPGYLLQEIGEEFAAGRVSQQRIKVLTDGHPSPLEVIPRKRGGEEVTPHGGQMSVQEADMSSTSMLSRNLKIYS